MLHTARTIHAATALMPDGWQEDVRIVVGTDGRIASVNVAADRQAGDEAVHTLLPAPTNLHSHAFQRAMAGLGETRTSHADSFWTWREVMYRFVEALTPEDVEAVAAYAYMEMLEGGFAAVGEFHYLHHQPDGTHYNALAEMAERIAAAASTTGIGLTLLPVLYTYGGCDRRALAGGQRRFAATPDQYAALWEASKTALGPLPDANVGVAPHSLRAVDPEGLAAAIALAGDAPIHIHVAEQTAEVEEVLAHRGARPVAWLMDNAPIGDAWCLIHATHMSEAETKALARSGATAGLCPLTEASLGDGTFPAVDYRAAGGKFGVGTDSHIAITLQGELRQLETSQRLRDRARAVLAEPGRSNGRVLYDAATAGGARACQRDAGAIKEGRLADLVALDDTHPDFIGRRGDAILDAFIFSGAVPKVDRVWSAGRPVVIDGRHVERETIISRYKTHLSALMERISI